MPPWVGSAVDPASLRFNGDCVSISLDAASPKLVASGLQVRQGRLIPVVPFQLNSVREPSMMRPGRLNRFGRLSVEFQGI